MSEPRARAILDEWRAAAGAAALPATAPRPTRRVHPYAAVGAAIAAVALLVALLTSGAWSPRLPNGAAGESGLSSSPTPTVPVTPSPSEIATSALLPNPGGTCSASQFVVDKAHSGYTFGTALSRHAYLDQSLRNLGGDCVLKVPATIAVAPSNGPFRPLDVTDTGNEVCVKNACHYITPGSYSIRSGESLTIGFSVSWWAGANDENGKPLFSAPPCEGAIHDVALVQFPLASGAITIDIGGGIGDGGSPVLWHEVCSAPHPAVWMSIEPATPPK
jgi:hypothetical protein